MRPLALDLFCGAGGATLGLMRAGWEVVGVDVDARCAAVYPGLAFVRLDALGVEAALDMGAFGLVWASPPCQRWTVMRRMRHDSNTEWPDLIGPARELLSRLGARTVIENVPAAPIRRDLTLTGPAVGLPRLLRRRCFELGGFAVPQPDLPPPAGSVAEGTLVTVTTQGGIPCRRVRERRRALAPHLNPNRHALPAMVEAMGLPADCGWTMRQVGEAVPPAYAELIGRAALEAAA